MDNIDHLVECGFSKPITRLELCDRIGMVQTVALHKVLLGCLAELSQFRDGLAALGVLDALKHHSRLLAPFFCQQTGDGITSGLFISLVKSSDVMIVNSRGLFYL